MFKLMDMKLKAVTEASISGYNPNQVDKILRPTEVRAVSEWFLRALVGGVAYDNQYDEEEAARISQEMIFGADSRGSLIYIRSNWEAKSQNPTSRGYLGLNPRYKLLTMGARNVQFIRYPDQAISIYTSIVRSNLFSEIVETALSSIILAIILGGFGKGSRRGFGSFIPYDIKTNGHFNPSHTFNRLISEVKGLYETVHSRNLNILSKKIRLIIELSYSIAESFFNKVLRANIAQRKAGGPPNIPVISREASWIDLVFVNLRNITGSISVDPQIKRKLSPLDIIQMLIQRSYYHRVGKKGIITRKGGVAATLQGVYGNTRNQAIKLMSLYLGLPRRASIGVNIQCSKKEFKEDVINQLKNRISEFLDSQTIPSKDRESLIELADDFFDIMHKKVRTGYHFPITRRASSIIISALYHDRNSGIFTMLKTASKDWPNWGFWVSFHRDYSLVQIFFLDLIKGTVSPICEINLKRCTINKQVNRRLNTLNKNRIIDLFRNLQGLRSDIIRQNLISIFRDYGLEVRRVWP